ncbi:B3 domain-containing protein Os03g0212300-like isoform X1 [Punica granatum]|uniref:B3 domain-containing protein Os03g0212300-like isoform X1 n=1 Tax=Punica granatum TaxID=22663 RepID=A0A218WNQ7_PUNGR|nr:B3 domain-containing protein Os03g0212300-like isoform X1 [Punica granatum]OWM74464.1 hypothetical protein CDL15_Pgr003967 [Punica granatum]
MADSGRLQFFKVFLETQSKNRLRIPPAYHKHMEGEKRQVFCLLGPSGDTWQVILVKVLEKDSNELYFRHGWATFVKDHLIENGDLLLFRYIGESNFNVEIFGCSGCPKEASFRVRCSQGRRSSAPARCSFSQNPKFTTTINESNERLGYVVINRVFFSMWPNIPMRFARSYGLLQKHCATLVDPSGEQWLVELRLRARPHQLNMYSGWREFSSSNDIKIGDTCVFELLHGPEDSQSFSMMVHINELP